MLTSNWFAAPMIGPTSLCWKRFKSQTFDFSKFLKNLIKTLLESSLAGLVWIEPQRPIGYEPSCSNHWATGLWRKGGTRTPDDGKSSYRFSKPASSPTWVPFLEIPNIIVFKFGGEIRFEPRVGVALRQFLFKTAALNRSAISSFNKKRGYCIEIMTSCQNFCAYKFKSQ